METEEDLEKIIEEQAKAYGQKPKYDVELHKGNIVLIIFDIILILFEELEEDEDTQTLGDETISSGDVGDVGQKVKTKKRKRSPSPLIHLKDRSGFFSKEKGIPTRKSKEEDVGKEEEKKGPRKRGKEKEEKKGGKKEELQGINVSISEDQN